MSSFQDFRQKVLGPLLRGELPEDDGQVVLFAVEVDRPLDYVFETARWDEITGAARRLARANDKLRAILATDGYTPADLLQNSPGSIVALCDDPSIANRWAEAAERAFAGETDIVTVSSVVRSLTTKQIMAGLYGAPRVVIGVPGVNDYQERINRYYGLASPSTVPTPDAVAERRHFGEIIALLHSLLHATSESRQIVPFYEALPFAERCASCRIRPAERLDDNNDPACGVCLRKRAEGQSNDAEGIALVWLGAIGLESVLEQQRTPLAYRRLCIEVVESLRAAIKPETGTLLLAEGNGWLTLATPPARAFEIATSALERIALHYKLRMPTGFGGAIALPDSTDQEFSLSPKVLYPLMERIGTHVQRYAEGKACLLDVRSLAPGQAFDSVRKPFTLDEARQIIDGSAILREADLPGNPFPDLPDQMARGSAGLYYTFQRSALPKAAQGTFQRLERTWEVGAAPGPRYFSMLSAALLLARQS